MKKFYTRKKITCQYIFVLLSILFWIIRFFHSFLWRFEIGLKNKKSSRILICQGH